MTKKQVAEEIKEVEATTEEKILGLIQKAHDVLEKTKELHRKTVSIYERIERENSDVKNELFSFITTINKKIKDQNEYILKGISVAENTEETLLNVLLAIRQNEYLQAWYPEQQGYPEMKVVGQHPLQKRKVAV